MEPNGIAPPIEYKREVMSLAEWRATQVGMWAWLMQRVTALAAVVFVLLHLTYPYQVIFQVLLLASVAFHLALGLRVIVLDIGARAGLQRVLFAAALTLGAVLLAVALRWRILY
jgi:succinate dehydrogenase / fumarate reductase cytochrome b subunit